VESTDLLRGTVRAAIGEYQRLLETQNISRASPTWKCFGFDLVQAVLVVEHSDRRAAAVAALNAERTSVHIVNALRDIESHFAAARQRLDGMVDHGFFIKACIRGQRL